MRIRFFLLLTFLSIRAYAQDSTFQYSGRLLVSGSSAQTPFWVSARQQGAVPASGTFTLGQFALTKLYHPHDPRVFKWSARAELTASYAKKADFFFTDLYLAGKLGAVELLAGQQRSFTGLVMDSTLTSGSLAMSDNARPFPKIQISIPEFYPLAFTNNYVSVKASYSDGLLQGSNITYGATRFVERTYFHQKTFYLKFGGNSNRFQVYTGFNHQAVWGGEKELAPLYKLSKKDAYWHTVTAKKLDHKIIGNHFGTVDIAFAWLQPQWTYSVYRQNIFESGSLYKIINYRDGLNGVSVKRNKTPQADATYFSLNSAMVEVIGTKSQRNNNPAMGLGIFEYGNYFNHYIYQNGWSYRGNNFGTPLAPAKGNTIESLPRSESEFTNNNRFWAFHTGLTASWLSMNFIFRGTHSLNYGTYISDFVKVKHQTSVFLSAEKRIDFLKGSTLTAGLSADTGAVLPKSYGLLIGLRKSGFLN
ncbi:capsule assembly Wzi family protein [Dyadobacter sp. CY312]|uniref:capsule assembly Wzi family protein n=1 Tax=Dyadobacter sp. CY312 TaxID=2907303 RepID=UPI001F388A8A|nr:capsule assembly Wzi family protein [Dyadobacter sp. CY312]MCE7041264.1 capsule assembly Wzi family protein [Dyadobacter sp. CY312]